MLILILIVIVVGQEAMIDIPMMEIPKDINMVVTGNANSRLKNNLRVFIGYRLMLVA